MDLGNLLGLAGVVVGAVIGATATFLIGKHARREQRDWAIADARIAVYSDYMISLSNARSQMTARWAVNSTDAKYGIERDESTVRADGAEGLRLLREAEDLWIRFDLIASKAMSDVGWQLLEGTRAYIRAIVVGDLDQTANDRAAEEWGDLYVKYGAAAQADIGIPDQQKTRRE